jgi:hypothetical protein
MQKIDDCKEIRLALTRAGIAICPEKCLQTFRLVVTAQYIYHTVPINRVQLTQVCLLLAVVESWCARVVRHIVARVVWSGVCASVSCIVATWIGPV